jgi:hypothetical protein
MAAAAVSFAPGSLMPLLLSKPYNEITWPMTHDAHCYANLDGCDLARKVLKHHSICQTRSIPLQLRDGIRCLRINCELVRGKVRLCHGAPVLQSLVKMLPGSFAVKTIFQRLVQLCAELTEFWREQPNELITLIDEGSAPHDAVEECFRSCFPETSAQPWLRISYLHAAGPWPTVSELLDKGVRLVVFRKCARSEDYERPARFLPLWQGDQPLVWQTPWCV